MREWLDPRVESQRQSKRIAHPRTKRLHIDFAVLDAKPSTEFFTTRDWKHFTHFVELVAFPHRIEPRRFRTRSGLNPLIRGSSKRAGSSESPWTSRDCIVSRAFGSSKGFSTEQSGTYA